MTWSTIYPRVKDVLKIYDEEGIYGLAEYYNRPGMVIPSESWHDRVVRSMVNGHVMSLECELNLAIDKLKIAHERYSVQLNPYAELAECEIKLELDKLNQKENERE